MQAQLAALYDTPIEQAITDFLITDARLAAALGAKGAEHNNRERVLLHQHADGLDISLYLDPTIVASLEACDPYTALGAENLNDFLIALEGVSHFNYIVWNAVREREVSQLELELQAEVDKFVSVSMLLSAQGADAAGFQRVLFDGAQFDAEVDPTTGQRYRAANRYAGKYCRGLSRSFPAQHREPSFMNEIRRFYRLPQHQKIRRIEQHHAA